VTAPPIGCSRCGGFDPACPRCAARRLALEQADALDAAGPRTPHRDRLFETWLDETEQDDLDPTGGDERSSRGGPPVGSTEGGKP
jgi:hypothetical protein